LSPNRFHTHGPGSRAAGLAMAFKLIEAAQTLWRAVNAPHLVALVRAGAVFEAGKLVERPDDPAQPRSRLKDLHPQVLTIAHRPTGTAIPGTSEQLEKLVLDGGRHRPHPRPRRRRRATVDRWDLAHHTDPR